MLCNFGRMLVAASMGTSMLAIAADEPVPSGGIAPFAMVGDALISLQHYNAVYNESSRNTFYHGKPPELEIAQMQRKVGDKLITDKLLVIEAQRRNIKPDEAEVEKKLALYERSNADDPRWLAMRDAMLPQLTRQIKDDVLAEQFSEMVRDVAAPSDKQLRQYYKDHADLFTQPEQVRVSRILIKVIPGADQDTWNTARDKLLDITKQVVEGGANFGELAQRHSDDDSAENMGDLGYLHGGMLAEGVQRIVDDMKLGDISGPIVTTEGVSIVQLTARDPASLNSFENVKERAAGLWQREEGEKALETLIADLKAKTRIWVNEARYLPLATEDGQ